MLTAKITVRREHCFCDRIWYFMGTNYYYSGVVPSLTRIMGTERYIFLRCTHIKQVEGTERYLFSRCALIRTHRGYKTVSSLALYPDSDKSWVQSGIFSHAVPWFGQAEGAKRHLLLLCALIRTSHGYKTVSSLSLCPFWKLSRNQ